jgi:hypothetical protein
LRDENCGGDNWAGVWPPFDLSDRWLQIDKMTWFALLPFVMALSEQAGVAAPVVPVLSPQEERRIYWEWRAAELSAMEDCARAGTEPQAATQNAKQRLARGHGMTVEQLDALVARQQAVHGADRANAANTDWILVSLFILNTPFYLLIGRMVFGDWTGFRDLWAAEGNSVTLSNYGFGGARIDATWAWLKLVIVIAVSVWIVFGERRLLAGWGW